MIERNIAASVLLIIFFLPINLSASQYCIEIGNSDGIDYKTVSSDCGHRDEAVLINQRFLFFRESIFNEYDIHIPAQQRVIIACGAFIFRELTGKSADIAGLYMPATGEFFFQRPYALNKKGILDRTIQHELFHCAVAAARTAAGRADCTDYFYIEESVSTALYPAGNYNIEKGKKILSALNDEKKIKNYLDQFLPSSNEKERSEAYAVAFMYGSSLIKSIGKQKAFRRAVGFAD